MKSLLQTLLIISLSLGCATVSGQDILNLPVNGDPTTEVHPKNTVTNEGNRYIIYDKVNNASLTNTFIGVTKVNVFNQVIYDAQVNLANNTTYSYDHTLKVVDVEVWGNNLLVLATIGGPIQAFVPHALLLTIDKNTGALLQREMINPRSSQVSDHQNNFAVDLYIGRSDDVNDPYICILSEARSTANSLAPDGQAVLMYRKASQSLYQSIGFDAPTSRLFENFRIAYFAKGATMYYPDNAVTITATYDKREFFWMNYHFGTDAFTRYFWDPLAFLPSQRLKTATHFTWDGHDIFYGQLYSIDNPSENGDFYVLLNGEYFFTYRNPGFSMIGGDPHPNTQDYNFQTGWTHTTNPTAAYTGLYYDPTDPTHPRYAVGILDVHDVGDLFSGAPLRTNTYTLRNGGGDAPSFEDLANFTGLSTTEGIVNLTGCLYRKPITTSNASNAYYLKQMTANSGCNDNISFTPMGYIPGGPSPGTATRRRFGWNITPDLSFVVNYNLTPGGTTAEICVERLTNGNNPPFETPGPDALKVFPSTAIAEDVVIAGVTISPNPVVNQFRCTSAKLIKAVYVFDLLGKEVVAKSSINQNQVLIDVKGIATGSYFVRVLHADGKVVTQKIIKL